MELVDNKKLEAAANLIGEMEVEGYCVCIRFNNSLKDRIDVPCDIGSCEGDCPFYSKENFLRWIKPDKKLSIREVKRPKAEDFAEHIDNYDDVLIDYPNYAEALERYCSELEKALDNACEYIHDCGSNGCPNNYDGEEMKECKMCNYECMSLDDQLNSSKSQYDEYLKKSIKCWKEYFLRGDTEDGNK